MRNNLKLAVVLVIVISIVQRWKASWLWIYASLAAVIAVAGGRNQIMLMEGWKGLEDGTENLKRNHRGRLP